MVTQCQGECFWSVIALRRTHVCWEVVISCYYIMLMYYLGQFEHLLSVTWSRMLALIEIELSMMLLVSDQSISLLSFGEAERTST